MEEPKISWFNWFAIIGTMVTLVSGLLPYASWTLPWKLLMAAFCITLSICYSLFDFHRKTKKYYADFAELQKRHLAISGQFDQKNKVLDEYEYAFSQFGDFILMALTQASRKEQDILKALYGIFQIQGQKIKGDKFNG